VRNAVVAALEIGFSTIFHGAACYHEHMPYDRLAEDVRLMKRAGLTARVSWDEQPRRSLLSQKAIEAGERITLGPWALAVVRE
jgi:hypothetical protein